MAQLKIISPDLYVTCSFNPKGKATWNWAIDRPENWTAVKDQSRVSVTDSRAACTSKDKVLATIGGVSIVVSLPVGFRTLFRLISAVHLKAFVVPLRDSSLVEIW